MGKRKNSTTTIMVMLFLLVFSLPALAVQAETVTTEVVSENGEVVAVAPKKVEKDMTESERMDVEVQRIKKRMLEINDKIENYNKTNEMIDNLEKNVGELERKVNY